MKLTLKINAQDAQRAIALGFGEHLKCFAKYLSAYHEYFEQCAAERYPAFETLEAEAEFEIPPAIATLEPKVRECVTTLEVVDYGAATEDEKLLLDKARDACKVTNFCCIWNLNHTMAIGMVRVQFHSNVVGALISFDLYTPVASNVAPPVQAGRFARRFVLEGKQ